MKRLAISSLNTKSITTLLAMIGIGIGIVALLLQRQDEPPAESRQPAIAATAAAATFADVSPPRDITDIFAIRTWVPPAPPAAKPAPAPPPQAPSLPFKFVGQIDDGLQGRAFILADSQRVFTVSPGDSIDERYRLEKFENGQLHFLYLPMNAQQVLSIGNSL